MEEFTDILTKIFLVKFPNETNTIPGIIRKVRGREKEYLLNICRNQNIRLSNFIKADPSILSAAIIRKYEPEKIQELPSLLSNYKELEDDLLKQLCTKHNINLNEIIFDTYINITPISDAPIKESIDNEVQAAQKIDKPVASGRKNHIFLYISIPLIIIITIILTLYFTNFFHSNNNSTTNSNNLNTEKTDISQTTDKKDNLQKTTDSSGISNKNSEKVMISEIIPSSVTASSYMKPSFGLTYNPSNVSDNDLQTWWSPANPNSNGLNSWIKLDFGSSVKVSYIEIHNGSHYSNFKNYGDLYLKNNRLTKAKLEFSNGYSTFIYLQQVDQIQKFTFTPQNTKYINLIPMEWANGSLWTDLCISEFKAYGER